MSETPSEKAAVADASLYFSLVAFFFICVPGAVMLWRLIARHREGLMAMFSPPYDLVAEKRRLSSRVRHYLFQRTSHGFKMDIIQAVFSAVSCLLFIVISYASAEPVWVTDVEDFITVYFAVDYGIRLWLAQDTLRWYFSMTSLLDFITVVPAITVWLLEANHSFDPNVTAIVQSIRAFRVFRMFRVIRVIRLLSLSPSYAFQRQIFVLAATVISLIFVAAGLYQITEGGAVKTFPFHKAVYYATITVVGRPGVPVDSIQTAVFLTITVLIAVTVIPTFVAELIRLWFDNTSLETFRGNPENPHVIICGDTNVSRLRALTAQYFNKSRDPDTQTPIVILADAKPEGALRHFIESYKFSGLVRYIRGSARRAADLRRADIGRAKSVIVLNYRADKAADAADAEVLSTVMAVKNVAPGARVLAQLYKPRKRNHLKAVPGWQDRDKSVSAVALGMTLMGLSCHVPGLSTFVVNLVRRGSALSGLPDRSLKGKALPWWHLMLYGDAAKAAAMATLSRDEGASTLTSDGARYTPRSPLEEYALSIEACIHEVPVQHRLYGRTFGATARLAYLRYGITLIGATLPVNDDVFSLVPGLPKTYRLVLFPSDAVLRRGMKLYAMAPRPEDVESFRVDSGGTVRSTIGKVVDTVSSAFVFGNGAASSSSSSASAASVAALEAGVGDASPAGGSAAAHGPAGSDGHWHATGAVVGGPRGTVVGDAAAAPGAVGAGDGSVIGGAAGAGGVSIAGGVSGYGSSRHNASATSDLSVPWCFVECEERHAAQNALLHRLHLDSAAQAAAAAMPVFSRFGGHDGDAACPGCSQTHTRAHSITLLHGQGICVLGTLGAGPGGAHDGASGASSSASGGATGAPKAPAAPAVTVSSDDFSFEKLSAAPSSSASTSASSSSASGAAGSPLPEAAAAAGAGSASPAAASASSAAADASPSASDGSGSGAGAGHIVIPRRTSLGDDGLGAIDDTDDIQGPHGPLLTHAPSASASAGIALTAQVAALANTNALAVRLALPVTAVTDVESMAADALDGIASARYKGHVLVCGATESMGYLLRAIASLFGPRTGVSTLDYGVAVPDAAPLATRAGAGAGAGGDDAAAAAARALAEGEQYTVRPEDIVVLAPSKPSDASLNAMYPGSATLLSRVTFIAGNPAEAGDLLRAGVQTARAAVILTGSKASASPDGGDNLTDDCDAIVTASVIGKLAPGLHIVSELLHGAHAPYLRPAGAGLNDAARGALIAVLEERESSRQRSKIEDAIRSVAAEREIRAAGRRSTTAPASGPAPASGRRAAAASGDWSSGVPDGGGPSGSSSGASAVRVLAPGVVALPPGVSRTDILLSKLTKQRMRLRAAMTGALVFGRPSAGPSIVFGSTGSGSQGGFASARGPAGPSGSARLAIADAPAAAPGSYALAVASGSSRGGVVSTSNPLGAAGVGGSGNGSGVSVGRLASAVEAMEQRGSSSSSSSAAAAAAAAAGGITDADLEQLAERGLSTNAIVDVLVGVREDFGSAAAAASDGASISLGGGGGSGGASKGSGATNDLFGAPAYAAGRVFTFNTLDAVICEAHFDGSVVGVVKQLVRAARRQRFVAIPLTEALIMARLVAPGHAGATAAGTVSPSAIAAMREAYLSELAADIIGAARGTAGTAAAAGVPGPAEPGAPARPRTYGQLFEALIRGWRLLPMGLYRRVHPATGLHVHPQTTAALQLAAGPPSLSGSFVHNRALVSYVYTCPPPDTLLSEHDLVYVLLPEASVSADGVFNHGAGAGGDDDV